MRFSSVGSSAADCSWSPGGGATPWPSPAGTPEVSSGNSKRWRERMVKRLAGRPEGFSDGRRLIPGRLYRARWETK
ncbi:MAG: hypothetical protein MUF25_24410 [Pirellulaceae bacterium]|nr:hypothetical protein [Pirellulaceae bacterium]